MRNFLQNISLTEKVRMLTGIFVMLLILSAEESLGSAAPFIALPVYLFVSYNILKAAYRDITVRRRMSEQFLMSIATLGALALQDYAEAIAVMVFYLIGKAFENYAAGRSRNEITELLKLKPEFVRLVNEDGSVSEVKPRKVKKGMKIRIFAGEAIGLDGILLNESASVDLSALTGESEPAVFVRGEEVPSGGINRVSVIDLEVSKTSKDSSVTRLINLIEDAAANKSKPEAMISRYAGYYTPAVVGLAVLMALTGLLPGYDFADYLNRALVFLVISCPCALVLSVPLTFFGGLGAESRLGMMVKGSIHLETMAAVKAVAFDKTGTVTEGAFKPVFIYSAKDNVSLSLKDTVPRTFGTEISAMLKIAYALESSSAHPVGRALSDFCKEADIKDVTAEEVSELAGFGLKGKIEGKEAAAGQSALMVKVLGIDCEVPQSAPAGTAVHIACDGEYLGCVVLSDQLRSSAPVMTAEFRKTGLESCMITGDREAVAAAVAAECGTDVYYAEQLPEDKLKRLQELRKKAGCTAFIGDGINDAPSLAAADIGIAMGKVGSAAAVEAADAVLLNTDLSNVPKAFDIARRTCALARQNMILVMGVKILILLLGAFGFANIWLAVLGDVGLCVVAVLNAMRTLNWAK